MNEDEDLDLWGNIDFSSPKNEPLKLLEIQASKLTSKSNGSIKGEIHTSTDEGIIFHTFFLVVPSLDDYRYALFKVASGIQPYPIFIYDNSYEEGAIKVQSKKKIPRTNLIGDIMMNSILKHDITNTIGYEYVGQEIPEPDYEITNYKDFKEAIEKILTSKGTKSIISSILTKINN